MEIELPLKGFPPPLSCDSYFLGGQWGSEFPKNLQGGPHFPIVKHGGLTILHPGFNGLFSNKWGFTGGYNSPPEISVDFFGTSPGSRDLFEGAWGRNSV